jgi:hypothetical protein
LIAFHRGFMLSTEENQPLETREHCCHSEWDIKDFLPNIKYRWRKAKINEYSVLRIGQ